MLATEVAKVNGWLLVMVTSSPPLFWSVTESPAPRPVTVPPTENVRTVQVTVTVDTFELAMIPVPLATTHVSAAGELGLAETVTAYEVPTGSGVANAKLPLEPIESDSPLACKPTVSPGASPRTVPPTVYVAMPQLTTTLDTLAAPTVPAPALTEQVCPEGCVLTETM